MHALLVHRADMLEGCQKGSVEEAELVVIVDAIEAYEAVFHRQTTAGERLVPEACT